MTVLRRLRVSLCALVAGGGAGCDVGGADGGGEARPCAVVAVSFDAPLEGLVDRLEVEVETGGGEELVSRFVDVDGRTPVEVPLPHLETGTRLLATVTAYKGDELLLRQLANTDVLADRTLLVPVRLNDECIPHEGERDVSCEGSTCRAGVCELPYLDPYKLGDYEPDWSRPPVGHCGAVDAGEPKVWLGHEGEPFVPLKEGDVLRPYHGLQGGYHFFYSVRMSGADEVSAVTHHFDTILSTGRESSVLTIAEPYQVDEDGCHRFDVPWILPPVAFIGETMRLGVTVTDATGNAGHGHIDIVVGEPIEPP